MANLSDARDGIFAGLYLFSTDGSLFRWALVDNRITETAGGHAFEGMFGAFLAAPLMMHHEEVAGDLMLSIYVLSPAGSLLAIPSLRGHSIAHKLPLTNSLLNKPVKMNYSGVYEDAAYHRSKHSHSHHRHRHHSSTSAAMPQTIPFRRSHTTDTHSHPNPWTPWDDMAQTLSRVLEEDMAAMACQTDDMFRRVLQQQERYHRSDNTFRAMFDTSHLSSLFFADDHHQAYKEAWRADAQRLREQEDAMREQLRRLQQARLETERCRAAYERQKAEDTAREQRRRKRERKLEKARREEADKKAWQAYEEKWADITSTSATPTELTFRTIPWPMFSEPRSLEEINPSAVKAFVLSPLHSEGQSRKERIKSALKRWHPDRFGRVLVRVVDCDKASVEDGVGIIVRCLNSLLENESGKSS